MAVVIDRVNAVVGIVDRDNPTGLKEATPAVPGCSDASARLVAVEHQHVDWQRPGFRYFGSGPLPYLYPVAKSDRRDVALEMLPDRPPSHRIQDVAVDRRGKRVS